MNPPPTQLLHQHWVHSHEEDAAAASELGVPAVRVYRHADFPFPRSRGRSSLRLDPGGVASQEQPGPVDRTVALTAHWQLEGPETLVLKSAAGSPSKTLHILTITPERLVVEKP